MTSLWSVKKITLNSLSFLKRFIISKTNFGIYQSQQLLDERALLCRFKLYLIEQLGIEPVGAIFCFSSFLFFPPLHLWQTLIDSERKTDKFV